jgi:hypothetical protein
MAAAATAPSVVMAVPATQRRRLLWMLRDMFDSFWKKQRPASLLEALRRGVGGCN